LFTFLVAKLLAAERVPFDICAESITWTRRSPEVQAKIWNDPRYSNFARDAYAWTHNFSVVLDPESTNELGYLSNLSGLSTAIVSGYWPGGTGKNCGSTQRAKLAAALEADLASIFTGLQPSSSRSKHKSLR